jgi:Protein of unknown function (DUF3750)
MSTSARLLLGFFILFLIPLATHAAWWLAQKHPASWSEADWSSAGVLPDARRVPGAVVHVLAGRTGRWKGIFAHHTWIVLKPAGETRYTRYDVVGWGRPVRTDGWAPDGRWYSDAPHILTTLRGSEAEEAVPRIQAAIASYPFRQPGTYQAWPGPNSNTFVAHIAREVPELAPGLLPTALGKDFTAWPLFGLTPSHTGIQLSFWGLAGVSLAWVEGIEVNVLGLVAGLDLRRPAVKLPGWGRIGLPAS